MGLYNLDKLFEPESVAVIGASEKKGSIGSVLVENLVNAGYAGDIYPAVNRRRSCAFFTA